MSQAASPSGIVDTFKYDGDGMRVQKVDSTGTSNFLSDGKNILKSKQYRSYSSFGVNLACDCNNVLLKYSIVDESHSFGYTPNALGLFLPGKGEQIPKIMQGISCITVSDIMQFRIGQPGRIFSKMILGVKVPCASTKIEYNICYHGNCNIDFRGTYYPSLYYPAHKGPIFDPSVGMRLQQDIEQFMIEQGVVAITNFASVSGSAK